MCLILFAYDVHPDCRLILAANRDEFYNRPTQPLSFWNTSPGLIGGRDLQNGGTWLGMTPEGRWAAITNYREPHAQLDNAPSRGFLITNYLKNSIPAESYLAHLQADAHQYNGFNLLLGSENDLFYFSNRKDRWLKMTSGIYGLSNRFLPLRGELGEVTLVAGCSPDHKTGHHDERDERPSPSKPQLGQFATHEMRFFRK